MKAKEKATQSGVGVEYKSTVSTRSDKASGHGDMMMQETKAAFSKSHMDSKKC